MPNNNQWWTYQAWVLITIWNVSNALYGVMVRQSRDAQDNVLPTG